MDEFTPSYPDSIPFTPFPGEPQLENCISRRLIADGLSRPRVSTVLRRWALGHEDVRRIVLYHSGARYSAAVLLQEPTVHRIRQINQELIGELHELFPPDNVPDTHVIGDDFADAPMFKRFGAITVIDKGDNESLRNAS